jgi:hypothetical protein
LQHDENLSSSEFAAPSPTQLRMGVDYGGRYTGENDLVPTSDYVELVGLGYGVRKALGIARLEQAVDEQVSGRRLLDDQLGGVIAIHFDYGIG